MGFIKFRYHNSFCSFAPNHFLGEVLSSQIEDASENYVVHLSTVARLLGKTCLVLSEKLGHETGFLEQSADEVHRVGRRLRCHHQFRHHRHNLLALGVQHAHLAQRAGEFFFSWRMETSFCHGSPLITVQCMSWITCLSLNTISSSSSNSINSTNIIIIINRGIIISSTSSSSSLAATASSSSSSSSSDASYDRRSTVRVKWFLNGRSPSPKIVGEKKNNRPFFCTTLVVYLGDGIFHSVLYIAVLIFLQNQFLGQESS